MKKGISLIVLVITIIVMIILAASVVITLSNTGIINRANEAVDLTNEAQVQDMAALIWADAYMDNKRGTDLVNEVTTKLGEQGVTADKWNITVTDTGVTVTNKNSSSGAGLGSLITAANYGDKVDYTVTVNGIIYDDWQIYYHNSDYVYLIAENSITDTKLEKGTTVASLTSDELALYEKFRVGNGPKYTLVDTVDGYVANNSQAVAQLIKDYANFANKTTYGTDVVGAIGGPTLELLVAGWNAKGYAPTMTLTIDTYGYKINNDYYVEATSDGLYVPSDYWCWLASPSAFLHYDVMYAGIAGVNAYRYYYANSVRPVVCLKSSIPATVGTGDYDFSLIKDKKEVGWRIEREYDADGKITKAVVTDGSVSYEIGTTVNYMPDGVGATSYKGGWKLLGVDDEGRLLIMSSDSVNGTVQLSDQEGFLNGLTTLENAVSGYKDGTIGVAVRSVTAEDIDAVTGYDKTTFTGEEYLGIMTALGMSEADVLANFGFTAKEQMSLIDNNMEVTYSWDGTAYPKYSYIKNGVTTTGNLLESHSSKGFTYYDKTTNTFKTAAYTTTPGTIATIENDMHIYLGSLKYAEDSKAYKMLFMTADESSTSTYLLASRCVDADPYSAFFGMHIVDDGGLGGNGLMLSNGTNGVVSYAVRAVVTLASGISLKDSTTVTGTYDIVQ